MNYKIENEEAFQAVDISHVILSTPIGSGKSFSVTFNIRNNTTERIKIAIRGYLEDHSQCVGEFYSSYIMLLPHQVLENCPTECVMQNIKRGFFKSLAHKYLSELGVYNTYANINVVFCEIRFYEC